MQIANVLVSLGGDSGNTVPKQRVTAAEIAVLMAIHGNEAINEVEPAGEIKCSHREERARLIAIYGSAKDEQQKPIVEGMFPGVAARVFETLDELGLADSMFKATGRMKAPPVEPTAEEVEPEAPAAEVETDDEDGVGEDMTDKIPEPADNILG